MKEGGFWITAEVGNEHELSLEWIEGEKIAIIQEEIVKTGD